METSVVDLGPYLFKCRLCLNQNQEYRLFLITYGKLYYILIFTFAGNKFWYKFSL